MIERPVVAVFGATGFLGRRLVDRLAANGFLVRAVARRPEASGACDSTNVVIPVGADIRDTGAVESAVAGARFVVNAVSLYTQTRAASFRDVHVVAAGTLARIARRAGVERLVHVSGIGADPDARDAYIRARGQGEIAARSEFPQALVVRPSVMCGLDDGFLTTLVRILSSAPAVPLFGHGRTRLQPVAADDVADAIVLGLRRAELEPGAHELGGPSVLTYRDQLEMIARRLGRRVVLLPVPFAFWRLIALAGERLPGAPLSRHMVALMERDNVADSSRMFELCGITPRSLESLLNEVLAAISPGGR